MDHSISTQVRDVNKLEGQAKIQVLELEKNTKATGIQLFDMTTKEQGIVHVMGPEQGLTLPGMTIVCGDSHTATHGAFGALAFGIGTSEVEHVLATQTLKQARAKNMKIEVRGKVAPGITAKDIILAIIGKTTMAGGTGHVVEFCGEAIRDLSMEGRMTVCNMAIEMGAKAGLIAPDETTFEYLKGRPHAPKGKDWDDAVAYWKTLKSDDDAKFDTVITLEAKDIAPQVTWGTNPGQVIGIDQPVPNPAEMTDPVTRASAEKALNYIGLDANTDLKDIPVDQVFIGSCTNARIEDLRAAAAVMKGRKKADNVKRILVVPGSGLVKEQAEKEGYCECKYCAGLRGDVRTHKAQILSWTHKKEMEFKFDDHTETLYIKTKIGFWKIYLKDDIDKYLLYHRNIFEANTDYQELIRGEFHRQKDVKQTDSLVKLVEYIDAHDKAKAVIQDDYHNLPRRTKKQKKYYKQAERKVKREAVKRMDTLFAMLERQNPSLKNVSIYERSSVC